MDLSSVNDIPLGSISLQPMGGICKKDDKYSRCSLWPKDTDIY